MLLVICSSSNDYFLTRKILQSELITMILIDEKSKLIYVICAKEVKKLLRQ